MSVLQELERHYHRLDARGEVAAPGWSPEKFGWCIVLSAEGEPVAVEDLHDVSGKKPKVTARTVPAAVKRTVGIAPNFLWDKTAYVLGRTAGEGKRTAQEHAAFLALHAQRLAGAEDEGLVALQRFLATWMPERFDSAPFHVDMLDANVLFRLDGETRFLHERPAARALVAAPGDAGEVSDMVHCLISGTEGIPARLHPTIKGVDGAQTAGAALVSFNLDAFTSLGKEQGDNAPTSTGAAFRYGAALNHLLTRGGPNRLRRSLGDATVVFWAEAGQADASGADAFAAFLLEPDGSDEGNDAAEALELRKMLDAVARGRPIAHLRPDILPGTRFHILGLSPNAARLSVRFWFSDSFDVFARRLAQHYADLAIEPVPYKWGAAPSVERLLANTTALGREFKNIAPQLAGEVMRAVLTGEAYPLTLLSAALIRLRAGDNGASGWHAAAIRAVLCRLVRFHPPSSVSGEPPVSLKRDHANPGYQLGRLFAVYELAQRAALGKVNATIRDRFYGAASATPAGVFPLIVRGGQNHLAKVRKEKPGWAHLIERELEEINSHFEPTPDGIWPRSLRLQDQGEFAIGYYHQRAAQLTTEKGEGISLPDDDADLAENEE